MSSSSRIFADSDSSRVELPVFITPPELVFSTIKRRTILVIYNPYGNDAHFKIMTTNPDRYDVSQTKGTIKPNRRIDITIRLLSNRIAELPEPTDEPQVVDHFRISVQVASLRGNRQLKVYWLESVEYSDNEDDASKSTKLKQRSLLKQATQPHSSSSISSSQRNSNNLVLQGQSIAPALSTARSSASVTRSSRSQLQDNHSLHNTGSNVNLVCFLGAILCVILLFLPLTIDSELCKRVKLYSSSENEHEPPSSAQSFTSRLGSLLSVSYEMKFGCSFALGLFTYRLISTMPD